MVHYSSSELIHLKDFEFAWRITDPTWAALPEEALKRIKPLSDERSKQLFKDSPIFGRGQLPCDPKRYHAVAQTSLEENDPLDSERIRAWFRGLPIALDAEVYLCWSAVEGTAAITDWGNVIQNWNDLWYPFDSMGVFDDSFDWAVVFGLEEQAYFVRRGPVGLNVASLAPIHRLAGSVPSQPGKGG